jgi:DNA-binding response OmpR family regulator
MGDSSSALHRPHVLVVSDDEDLRDFLLEGLVIGGFWVSAVASALQTLEVFRLRTFDLGIVDLHLGGMSAVELIKRLRSSADPVEVSLPRTNVPLVGLADSAEIPSAREALNAGLDQIMVPPIELENLVPLLHEIVRQWRAAHPGRPFADVIAQAVVETET